MSQTVQTTEVWPKTVGVLLTILAGIIAVATGVYVSHQGGYLWSLILVALVVEEIQRGTKTNPKRPLIQGIVSAIACLGVAAAVYFLGDANYLWALVLVAFLSDSVAGALM